MALPDCTPRRNAPIKILIVIGDPAKQIDYQAALTDFRENLIVASTEAMALRQLYAADVAVVVIDKRGSKLDGCKLASTIQREPRFKRVAIIMVSGTEADKRRMLHSGATLAIDFISAPFIPEFLRAKVSTFADLHRKTVALEQMSRELEQRVVERTAMIADYARQLRANEQRFRLLVENVPDYSMIMLDKEARVSNWNAGTERLYGYKAEEVMGRSFELFFVPEDQAGGVPAKILLAAKTQGHVRFERWRARKDGSRFWAEVTLTALQDDEGQLIGFSKILHDLTERKRVETHLRQTNAWLKERQEQIEQELRLAARVQQSLMPSSLTWGRIGVEAFHAPAQTIGGDFGLIIPRARHMSLMVCDVSGHGISSALVANRIYTETLAKIEEGIGLEPLVHHLNQFVIKNMSDTKFYFTMAAARVNRKGDNIEFCGAGHPPIMIVRPGGTPRLLESQNMVLGLLENAVNVNAVTKHTTEPGDRIVMYTDGFTESFNSRDEMLGVAGFAEIVRESASRSLAEMKQKIVDRVEAWRGGPAIDDLSLVVLGIP